MKDWLCVPSDCVLQMRELVSLYGMRGRCLMYVIAVRHRTAEYSGKEKSLCIMIYKYSLLLALMSISWQGS